MPTALRRSLPFAIVALTSAWLASTVSSTGDWLYDSWPAVHALAGGHLGTYLEAKAMMGPFATLVQAPFAHLSGGADIHAYRWAAFPCLLAAGLLGLYLASIAARRGLPQLGRFLLAGLCLVNPLTVEALQSGHPEEILTAALAVGAIATASEGRRGLAAVLLGLAIASKQWAVIAILPVLMALLGGRLRVGLAAAGIAAILVLPGVLASPGSFSEVNSNAASTGRIVTPWSVWYPVANVTTEVHHVDGTALVANVHEAPPLVGSLSHPLILVLALLIPLGIAARRKGFGLSGSDAMALFALLALLRCGLDPVDNLYYPEPLLLALLGWDAFAADRLPLRGLAGAALALLFRDWSLHLADFALYSDAYVAAMALAGTAFVAVLLRPGARFTGYSLAAARSCPQT
jgi:hypothetical protein